MIERARRRAGLTGAFFAHSNWAVAATLVAPFVGCGGASSPAAGPDLGTDAAFAVPPHGSTGPLASVSGKAFVFGPGGGDLTGATVSVVEDSTLRGTVDAKGAFSLQVPSGGQCSFVVHQPGFADTQSATLSVPATGISDLGFQCPTDKTYSLLAAIAAADPDPALCQVATTVSAFGTTPYGGDGVGEPGAVVTIDPPVATESGPVYFKYLAMGVIAPDRKLTETSIDGGVLFLNIPPGIYQLHASKAGKRFSSVTLRCRAGMLVNAAPPHGLQSLD